MKKLFLIGCVSFWIVQAAAQSIVPAEVRYLELQLAALPFSSNEHFVILNWGQSTKITEKNQDTLLGEDGKPKRFFSMVGVLNYFEPEAWELVDLYVKERGGTNLQMALLKRK